MILNVSNRLPSGDVIANPWSFVIPDLIRNPLPTGRQECFQCGPEAIRIPAGVYAVLDTGRE